MKKFVGYFIIILLFVGTGLGIFFGIEYAKNEKYIQENSATLEQVYELQQELDLIQGRLENALEQNELDYETITSLSNKLSQATDDLQECQSQLTTTTNNLNQALEQNKIDAEAIAGYLEDITELNGTIANLSTQITDLNNQIKYYQELLEAYENSGKYEVVFYLVQNGEQTPYDVQVVEPNGYLSEVVAPEGNFEGWSLSIGGDLIESLTSVQITEDTNIYGTFYSTVTFLVNDEEYATQQVGYNKSATDPEEPEVQYYTFEGWTLNGEDVVAVNTYQITQDTTFVAEFTKILSTFNEISWNIDFYGMYVWTDNEKIYYSNNTDQYILNQETDTWESKVWYGLTEFTGNYVWTDGENIYYSNNNEQYVLNIETSTWEEKVWYGLTQFTSFSIWTDNQNIYYSNGYSQYVLNRETSTWEEKSWNLSLVYGDSIWTDGENIYFSWGDDQYILNQETNTWEEKIWHGLTDFSGSNIWTDGKTIYYSGLGDSGVVGEKQYVLNQKTDTWEQMIWIGYRPLKNFLWSDGENIYYSEGINQYIIV